MLTFRLRKHYISCFVFERAHILVSSGFDLQLRLEIYSQGPALKESLSKAVELEQVTGTLLCALSRTAAWDSSLCDGASAL